MKAQVVRDELVMAVWQRRAAAGLIYHSDHGSQYPSNKFRQLLSARGTLGSLRRKGDCWANAVVESIFGSLKPERAQWRHYKIRSEAQEDVFNYIPMFYNPHRSNSYLGYKSPNQFEAKIADTKKQFNRAGKLSMNTSDFQEFCIDT